MVVAVMCRNGEKKKIKKKKQEEKRVCMEIKRKWKPTINDHKIEKGKKKKKGYKKDINRRQSKGRKAFNGNTIIKRQ